MRTVVLLVVAILGAVSGEVDEASLLARLPAGWFAPPPAVEAARDALPLLRESGIAFVPAMRVQPPIERVASDAARSGSRTDPAIAAEIERWLRANERSFALLAEAARRGACASSGDPVGLLQRPPTLLAMAAADLLCAPASRRATATVPSPTWEPRCARRACAWPRTPPGWIRRSAPSIASSPKRLRWAPRQL